MTEKTNLKIGVESAYFFVLNSDWELQATAEKESLKSKAVGPAINYKMSSNQYRPLLPEIGQA